MKTKRPPMLTGLAKLFVQEYIIDFNGRQAAIRAGYSAKSATVMASKLLRKPKIQEAIAAAMADRTKRTHISQDRVLQEWAILGFSNRANYLVNELGELDLAEGVPADAHRAIAAVKVKSRTDRQGNKHKTVEFRLWDKPYALTMLGKHLGMSPDRHEHTGKDGKPIEHEVTPVSFYIPHNGRDAVIAAMADVALPGSNGKNGRNGKRNGKH